MEQHVIRLDKPITRDNPVTLFFSADWQLGSALCDEQLIKRDLSEAKRRNAHIFLVGDLFDGIFPRDKRYAVSATADWLSKTDAHANRVVDRAAAILSPVSRRVHLIAMGNHEETVLQKAGVDLRDALRDKLGLPQMVLGGYCGNITLTGLGKGEKYLIRYDHGSGGDTLTKGLVAALRTKSAHRYDLFVTGHLHNRWCLDDVFVENGKIRPCKLLMVGGYLRTVNDRISPFSTYDERWGLPPKPTGGIFVTLSRDENNKLKTTVEI